VRLARATLGSVSAELTDLLDRQATFAMRQTDPAEFLLAVVRFTAFIHSDPRLEVYVQDIVREGGVFADTRRANEAKMVTELIAQRDQFARLAPDLDDSERAEPAFEESELDWELSLAYFDRLAASERGDSSGLPVGGEGLFDGSVPRQLIDLLTAKLRNARRPTTPP